MFVLSRTVWVRNSLLITVEGEMFSLVKISGKLYVSNTYKIYTTYRIFSLMRQVLFERGSYTYTIPMRMGASTRPHVNYDSLDMSFCFWLALVHTAQKDGHPFNFFSMSEKENY